MKKQPVPPPPPLPYSTNTNTNPPEISNTLTLPPRTPGSYLLRRLPAMFAVHAPRMLLDTAHNSTLTVLRNVHSALVTTGKKIVCACRAVRVKSEFRVRIVEATVGAAVVRAKGVRKQFVWFVAAQALGAVMSRQGREEWRGVRRWLAVLETRGRKPRGWVSG